MAQIPVRMNTQGMSFPLLSTQSGRTVIDGRGDLTYVPGVSADGDVPEDRGVPGVMYAHNVMPSTYGWQAVGYDTRVLAPASNLIFRKEHLVQGATVSGEDKPQASGLRTYVAVAASDSASDASLYYLDENDNWTPISNSPNFPQHRKVSTAYVNGYTYILIPNVGIYVFDISAGELIERDLNGINVEAVEGVFASNGYLLLWTARRVVWSSVTDVEDFEPSTISGAGGGAIQEAAGAIVYCSSTQLGFFVYTDSNVVSGVFTANEDFPFEYKEVPSAGGIYSPYLASNEIAGGYHYAFTTSGIQRISHTGATTQLSNISDFIGGRVFEDFDDASNTLVQTILGHDMFRMIRVVSNRYLIVSYSATQDDFYSHAIVVDITQNRMGKLRIPHSSVFEYKSKNAGTSLDSRSTIAFLSPDGAISTVRFSLDCQETEGVLLLGKIQYVHQRVLQLQEVELENVCPEGNFVCIDLPSLDGRTFEPTVNGYENPEDSNKSLKRYFFNNVAKSHSLLFKGTFELLTILVWFNMHGRN